MTLQEQYEKETEKIWWINPVCHGDRGFCSDEYMKWLEQKAEEGQKAIAAMEQIDTLWQSGMTQDEFDKQLVIILLKYKENRGKL